MCQLIDAMQGNFNMVCDQLREAQNFYDQAEQCIQVAEEEYEQIRLQQLSRPFEQYSSDEDDENGKNFDHGGAGQK